MRHIILLSALGLALMAAMSVDTARSAHHTTPRHTTRVDACLRAHGWPYGLFALQRAERRVGHPNGLIRICGGKDVV